MQKLKKVFSPGNDKDDEQMYGTPAARKEASQNSPGAGAAASPTTSQGSHPVSEGKEHGITRQILNPDGAKYDEQRYGTTTTAGSQPPVTRQEEAALASRMGEPKEDNGVKRQVLHPESNKPDETGYGATGFTGSEHKPHGTDHATGTSSRPNELGNVPPTNERYGTTGVAPGTAISTNERTVAPDTASRMSVKSGVLGSSDQRTTDRALGSDGITGQATPSQTETSHSGRNMALASATAAAGAGGAYAATRPHDQSRTSGDRDVESATYTDRSFPLAGGTTTHEDTARPPSSTYSTQAAGPSSTSAYIDPATSSNTNTRDAGGLGHGSSSAAMAGAGAGAGEGVTSVDVGQQLYADHSKHSHKFVGDPCEAAPQEPTFAPGPHHTVAANMLDPHIPGEFPREDGTDMHDENPLLGAGLPPQQTEASTTQEPFTGNTTGTAAERPSQEHHYARDAALAGGAGAAGLGAYAATRDHGDSVAQTKSQDYPSTAASTQQPQTGLGQQTSTQQSVAGDPLTGSRESEKEHHYGRDAALAGGAGAAGYGAYKLAGDRDNSDVAPQTTAPRESTTGASNEPVRRDVSDPVSSQKEKDHHYGRDAALAGGAGAAGYGAYKLADDRNEPATAPRHTTASTLHEPESTQSTLPDRTVPQQQQEPKDHHRGRDAALAGGAGAAGYGAYASTKDRDQPSDNTLSPAQSSTTTTTTTTTTSTSPRHKSALLNKLDPRVDSSSTPKQEQPRPDDRDSHTGRNAALAGGAGAGAAGLGYAAFTSNDDPDPTGPASKTIGPHSSNAANIVDPRVRPEPEKMKEHSTAGPWQSDSLNRLDPKVQSDPAKAEVKQHGYASGVPAQRAGSREGEREEDKEHHYGRDAAVVGGAGAAAYGGKQVYDQHEEEKLAREQAKEQAKEQERLAKEQEKQAKHDAKEQGKQAKEAEKQAKHDADEAAKAKKKEAEKAEKERQKEHEKMEKERAKEAEKAEKERQKEAEKQAKHDAKEQERLEKERSREEEKAAKERQKEEEKAEKERAKLAEKQEKEKEKEDERLAAAREEEAAKKHHEHNKLHKDPPEEREKKGGFIHRIFHHKAYDREGSEGARGSGSFEEGERPRSLENQNADEANHARTAQALEGERPGEAGVAQGAYGQQGYGQTADGQGLAGGRDDGIVTEKTTGLPMNVGQYGSGAGGTDGGQHIHGYETK